jgi:hypothetical protein
MRSDGHLRFSGMRSLIGVNRGVIIRTHDLLRTSLTKQLKQRAKQGEDPLNQWRARRGLERCACIAGRPGQKDLASSAFQTGPLI